MALCFHLLTVPLPPVRTAPAIFINLSLFICRGMSNVSIAGPIMQEMLLPQPPGGCDLTSRAKRAETSRQGGAHKDYTSPWEGVVQVRKGTRRRHFTAAFSVDSAGTWAPRSSSLRLYDD